jgi:glyoxylase-like metal-dependent hydrolase (beta-lactamase superfamily II)
MGVSVLAVLLAVAGVSAADSVSVKQRSVEQLAPGVWCLRDADAPDAFPQGNVTIVIGEREVLVVDSRYLPSTAQRDIAFVRSKTDLPVRWLVNTHWHFDHTLGNAAWSAAYPGLDIVAHVETARQSAGYNPGWFARYPERGTRLQKVLDDGRTADGRALSEVERREYADAIRGIAPVAKEFAGLVDRHPNVTFDDAMHVDLGGRVVDLLHLGRGNTLGDAVVLVRDAKLVVAGDLVDHPVPYFYGGFPFEQVDTLRALDRLDADILVPGHGSVLRGEAADRHLDAIVELLETVTALVRKHVHAQGSGSTNLEAVRAGVMAELDEAAWRDRFAGGDAENAAFFDASVAGLVTAAYREAWGN